MTEVPGYTKVLTLGARGTERALVGPVVVQEKVDGCSKGKLEAYLESFRVEARWVKAVQRMREDDILEYQPRDIGTLVKLVQADIREEETENIKEELYKLHIGVITRTAVRGLAEWYKAQLFSRQLLNLGGEAIDAT